MHKTAFGLGLFAVLAVGLPLSAETLDLPKEAFPGGNPATVMSRYWLSQAERAFERWQKDYETRTTPEAVAEYQKRMHEKFVEAIGGLPERTPLERTGYGHDPAARLPRGEGHLREPAEALRDGALFLPDAERFKPPYPGVLVPCGHAMTAKGHDEYQSMGALLALNGMAALVFDPIDQGERGQYLGEGGWPKLWGIAAHSMVGIGSILLGPQHGAIRDLGRHAGDRLSPIAARGRSETDRLHGQQRRRHADQLPDGAGRPHPRGGAELLSDELAQTAAHDRPAGLRAEHLRPDWPSAWTTPTTS